MSASEPKWIRLGNAAKIFPSTSSKKDPKVFRFSCELTEPVDGQTLQFALDQTMEKFPFYRSVLKRGYFGIISVSYTHLDVYKRQTKSCGSGTRTPQRWSMRSAYM